MPPLGDNSLIALCQHGRKIRPQRSLEDIHCRDDGFPSYHHELLLVRAIAWAFEGLLVAEFHQLHFPDLSRRSGAVQGGDAVGNTLTNVHAQLDASLDRSGT